jgi:hypothetical protein
MRYRTTSLTRDALRSRRRIGSIKSRRDQIMTRVGATRPKDSMICYCCGKKGHAAPECTQKDKIPRDEWHINKTKSNTQDSTENNETKSSGDKKGWSGFQREGQPCHAATTTQTMFQDELEDVIILDTGSTMGATVMNPKLLSKIKKATKPLEMVTNAGTKKMFYKGVIHGFGDALYDPNRVANIFGFAKLEDQCRITYDSSVEKALNVHTTDGIVKFSRNKDGLYVYRPSKNYLREVANDDKGGDEPTQDLTMMIQSVNENKKRYTQRQFDDA